MSDNNEKIGGPKSISWSEDLEHKIVEYCKVTKNYNHSKAIETMVLAFDLDLHKQFLEIEETLKASLAQVSKLIGKTKIK